MEDDALDADSRLERLLANATWPEVDAELRAVLRDDARSGLWAAAIEVLWCAVLDARETDVDSLVALLWHRRPELTLEENLVWSVIAKLKKLDYLANYDAEKDEGVRRELRRLRAT
ncbi:MAG: hypothetical protein ACO1OB_19560 [Archangium sp.]